MLKNLFFAIILTIIITGCGGNDNKLFTQLDKSDTDIDFRNMLKEGDELNVMNYSYFYNGAGVSVGDINNDGLADVFFTSNQGTNKLYLNKGNFKFEILKPIKKRNIVSYPDKGEYNNWLNKATELNAIGFKIAVSDLIEQTDFENGYDLADYYLNL